MIHSEKPDLSTEGGRKELAQYLVRCIEAGERQRGGLPERWSRLEKMAKSVPTDDGSLYDETSVPRTFPLLAPKVDQLVAAVCGPVLSSRPYFSAIGYGDSKRGSKAGQDSVQFLLERAQFDRVFRRAVRRSATSEPSIYYCWIGEQGPGLEVIHPREFILYPAYVGGIEKAQVCGDRYFMRLGDLLRGDYFPEAQALKSGDADEDSDAFGHSAFSEDEAVECWRLIVRVPGLPSTSAGTNQPAATGGGGSYWICRIARQKAVLLSAEPYGATATGPTGKKTYTPYSRPGYFEGLLQEAEEREFLRETPVAHKMQGLQLVFDKLLNSMIDGSEMAATPPIIATGAIGDAGKLIEYQPNSIIAMQGDVRLMPVPVAFNPGQMPALITLISDLADAASRVSQAGQGQQFSGSPTATEVSGVLQGQRMGLDEYRANACQGPAKMCEFLVELARLHLPAILKLYGDDFPVQEPRMLEGKFSFEPTGKTMESTPGALVEKVKLAMQMAQQMVMGGLLPPQLLIEFFKVLLDSLNLPIETHVLQKYFEPISVSGGAAGNPPRPGAGDVPQPGMGPAALQDPEFLRGLLEGLGGHGSGGPGNGAGPMPGPAGDPAMAGF